MLKLPFTEGFIKTHLLHNFSVHLMLELFFNNMSILSRTARHL